MFAIPSLQGSFSWQYSHSAIHVSAVCGESPFVVVVSLQEARVTECSGAEAVVGAGHLRDSCSFAHHGF